MADERRQANKRLIFIAVCGILIELTAIALVAGEKISGAVATPLIIVGMCMAFAPVFVLSRRRR